MVVATTELNGSVFDGSGVLVAICPHYHAKVLVGFAGGFGFVVNQHGVIGGNRHTRLVANRGHTGCFDRHDRELLVVRATRPLGMQRDGFAHGILGRAKAKVRQILLGQDGLAGRQVGAVISFGQLTSHNLG